MMRKNFCLMALAAILATSCFGNSANASQAYSFETILPGGGPPGPDGFFGLGAAVSQDTIGATDGSYSMKYLAGGGGFVGARTEIVPPTLNNPPGVQSVMFDMAIESLDPLLTFADMGVTIFGHDIDGGVFGIQNQFTDTVSIAALGVGQHTDLVIDLDSEFFSGQSFDEIFGDDVADLDVASAFQFYISKNGGIPVTVYIDNVRFIVPEPATGLLMGLCAVAGAFVRRR
jgi:PEP-CTERM motif